MTSKSFDRTNPVHLRDFRWAAAGLVKAAIQSRLTRDPDFLSEKELARWQVQPDNRSPVTLLKMTKRLREQYEQSYLGCGNSIPAPGVEQGAQTVDTLLDLLASFFRMDLDDTIARVLNNDAVVWSEFAAWESLTEIREALDQLPELMKSDQVTPPAVRILDKKHCLVCVNGQEDNLTQAGFNVVDALLSVYPSTLSKDLLIVRSGHADARGILKRLSKKEGWQGALRFGRSTGGGYGINPQPQ